MSDNTVRVLVTIVGAVVVVFLARWLMERAYRIFERRHENADPYDAARRRTTWLFVQRFLLAIIITGAVWAVLSQFEVTRSIAEAVIASGAVIALFAGIAFNVPLSNIGSGMLVAFSQPLRLGDRVTVDAHTGFVEDISLLYTTLATDDGLRVAIPNIRLTQGAIVNRTIEDPRRSVAASFLVPISIDTDRARDVLQASMATIDPLHDAPEILIGDIVSAGPARLVRLDVRAFSSLSADVDTLSSDVRRVGLAALRAEGLLEE